MPFMTGDRLRGIHFIDFLFSYLKNRNKNQSNKRIVISPSKEARTSHVNISSLKEDNKEAVY